MQKTLSIAAISAGVALGSHMAHAQTPIPPAPQDFVTAAAQADQYEIMAAHLAEVQGQDPRVRLFAQQMVRDHTRLTEDLRQAAVASGMQPPVPAMSSDQAALLGGLQGLRGADFDKAYARQQVLAHAQAVAVEESFADSGAEPHIKKAAQDALPTIRDHQRMAKTLQEQLGGS